MFSRHLMLRLMVRPELSPVISNGYSYKAFTVFGFFVYSSTIHLLSCIKNQNYLGTVINSG